MNVVLVGGFLGSGKTTFLRHLASFLLARQGNKVAVLENEVGEASIDDELLAREGFRVRGIFGGCICCQLTGDLVLAVNQIQEEFCPDWLLVETTGLAKPAAVAETLKRYGQGITSIRVVVLVDAGRWEVLAAVAPDLVLAQVGAADLLVVNKTDTFSGDLAGLEARLRELNGRARIVVGSLLEDAGFVPLEELVRGAACGVPEDRA